MMRLQKKKIYIALFTLFVTAAKMVISTQAENGTRFSLCYRHSEQSCSLPFFEADATQFLRCNVKACALQYCFHDINEN